MFDLTRRLWCRRLGVCSSVKHYSVATQATRSFVEGAELAGNKKIALNRRLRCRRLGACLSVKHYSVATQATRSFVEGAELVARRIWRVRGWLGERPRRIAAASSDRFRITTSRRGAGCHDLLPRRLVGNVVERQRPSWQWWWHWRRWRWRQRYPPHIQFERVDLRGRIARPLVLAAAAAAAGGRP